MTTKQFNDKAKKPYYFVAWNAGDNPKADAERGVDPLWYRVMVIYNTGEEAGDVGKVKWLTPIMFKEDARAKLEQIKKLIGEEGRYD